VIETLTPGLQIGAPRENRLAYNLRRVLNMVELPKLIAALPA
jgi:hypothetical protein